MRGIVSMLLLPLGLAVATGDAGANPFAPREPGGAAAAPSAPPRPAESAFPLPAVLRPAMARRVEVQRVLNQTVARELRAIRESGSTSAFLTVALVAFVWGVVHAAGPGHGKLVVSSYFLGRHARPWRGVAVGSALSLLQVLTAIALVGGLGLLLDATGFAILGHAVKLELASYGLIVVLGLYLAVAAVTGGHPHHQAEGGEGRTGLGLIAAAGLMPCASAILLLLFALANRVFLVGIAASVVMAAGMALTVSVVGVATILGRRVVIGSVAGYPRLTRWVTAGLSLAGPVLMVVIGGAFFAGAWTRL